MGAATQGLSASMGMMGSTWTGLVFVLYVPSDFARLEATLSRNNNRLMFGGYGSPPEYFRLTNSNRVMKFERVRSFLQNKMATLQ